MVVVFVILLPVVVATASDVVDAIVPEVVNEVVDTVLVIGIFEVLAGVVT